MSDHLIRNNLIRWYQALSNDFGRLTQSKKAGVRCTDAINFIHHSQLPPNTKVTYASFVCDYCPLKLEQWRVCLVVGSDKITCPYDTGSPAANLLELKILLKSVISDADKGARFMTSDLKDDFFDLPM